MVLTLKSVEFLEGVEPFRIENSEDVKNPEFGESGAFGESEAISAETDAGMSLMLEWKMRLSEDSDMCTTCNCSVDFLDRSVLIEHYQSQFHRTNTLRKSRNLPVYSEEDFEGIDNTENDLSTDQIGLESDDEEFDALLLPANRSFFTKDGHVFSIPRNILHSDEHDVSTTTFLRPFNCAIFLWNGGHFAAAVFENDKMTVQKSFHRYVARAKQGGVQSQHDAGGKGAAKSAGAKLRRYNEQKMKEEIESTMASWKQRLQATPLLFIRCAAYHRSVFFEANVGIEQRDSRIRTIPFETQRPNIDVITECWNRLQTIQEHGTDAQFRAEMEQVREKRKRLARKVAGKKRKTDGMQLICEWSDEEEEDVKEGKPKRTHHIKVRPVSKAPDEWPRLSEEWRQKAYNLVRQDDVQGLRENLKALNEDVIGEAHAYMKNAKMPPNRSTFLHVSAANDARNCLRYFLEELELDVGAKDGGGLPPYSSSTNSEVKSIFIEFRVKNEENGGGNWGRTHIPEPKKKVELSEEQEREKEEKRKEKKARQKEKEKQKKQTAREEAEEAADRKKYLEMSEREKRAMALERRLAGLPPVSRCHQCGTILNSTPFQYSHFNFCSPSCVSEHRKAHPS